MAALGHKESGVSCLVQRIRVWVRGVVVGGASGSVAAQRCVSVRAANQRAAFAASWVEQAIIAAARLVADLLVTSNSSPGLGHEWGA